MPVGHSYISDNTVDPFQVVMIVGCTALLVITVVLLIVRTMHSKPGINWWICASFLQAMIHSLPLIYPEAEQALEGQMIFFGLQLISTQAVCIGILLFTDTQVTVRSRMLFLSMMIVLMGAFLTGGYLLLAELLVVGYIAFGLFQALVATRLSSTSGVLFKVVGFLCLFLGMHWLSYPVLSKLDWFMPTGFLIAAVLKLSLFISLAVAAMLQFKNTTNDSEKKAIYAATHDPLTGVFNRSHLDALFDKYKTKIETAKSTFMSAKGTFILLYIDLDGFKAVNDTFGHKAGDEILIVVTKRLKNWLGSKGDVVRIGGDELVVLNTLRSDTENTIIYGTSAAQSILKLIEEPIIDGNNTYNISASIGGCYFGSEFNEMDVMLSRADELMYSAKSAGKRRVHFANIPKTSIAVSVLDEDARLELSKELKNQCLI